MIDSLGRRDEKDVRDFGCYIRGYIVVLLFWSILFFIESK